MFKTPLYNARKILLLLSSVLCPRARTPLITPKSARTPMPHARVRTRFTIRRRGLSQLAKSIARINAVPLPYRKLASPSSWGSLLLDCTYLEYFSFIVLGDGEPQPQEPRLKALEADVLLLLAARLGSRHVKPSGHGERRGNSIVGVGHCYVCTYASGNRCLRRVHFVRIVVGATTRTLRREKQQREKLMPWTDNDTYTHTYIVLSDDTVTYSAPLSLPPCGAVCM